MLETQQTVYIVDDDAAVRDALSILVKSVDLNAVEFSSADEFLNNYNPNNLFVTSYSHRPPISP